MFSFVQFFCLSSVLNLNTLQTVVFDCYISSVQQQLSKNLPRDARMQAKHSSRQPRSSACVRSKCRQRALQGKERIRIECCLPNQSINQSINPSNAAPHHLVCPLPTYMPSMIDRSFIWFVDRTCPRILSFQIQSNIQNTASRVADTDATAASIYTKSVFDGGCIACRAVQSGAIYVCVATRATATSINSF